MSPNENNHVASAWALLRQPEMDFTHRMSRKNQVRPDAVEVSGSAQPSAFMMAKHTGI